MLVRWGDLVIQRSLAHVDGPGRIDAGPGESQGSLNLREDESAARPPCPRSRAAEEKAHATRPFKNARRRSSPEAGDGEKHGAR